MSITEPIELYRSVPLLDGLYQITEAGQIASFHKRNPHKAISKRIDRAGYYSVRLTKEGKTRTCLLHRLLAQSFIPNPEKKPCVNHINGNKLDYRLSNLEWATEAENMQHAFSTGLCKASEYTSKKVIDITTGKIYKSIKEASKDFKLPYSTLKGYINGSRNNTSQVRLSA